MSSEALSASIITPVWNRADLTISFLQQNRRIYRNESVEFIIIDNGSTDTTSMILATWAKGNVKTIRNLENIGFGPANNQGAKEAGGKVLIFLNNDVIIQGDYVALIVEALANHPYDLVGAEYLDYDTGWNKFGEQIIPYIPGWCLAMRKRTFEALGGFDERYVPGDYEDIDLCYTASRAGRLLRPLDLPLAHLSGQSARKLPDRRKMTEKHRRLFAEKWGLP